MKSAATGKNDLLFLSFNQEASYVLHVCMYTYVLS